MVNSIPNRAAVSKSYARGVRQVIHRVQRYKLTLTTPDVYGDGNREVIYEPLTEKVILWPSDADEIRRQLLLMLKCKTKPLVVVFEPMKGR